TLEGVHEAFPDAAIYVRAFDRRALVKLKKSSGVFVVREVLESAVKMARVAMRDLGIAGAEIDRAEEAYRARDKERLRIQIEAGDIRAARSMVAEQQPWGNDPR
ncbi:MAG: sodium:proton exchanger, partial [Sphingomonas sp.]